MGTKRIVAMAALFVAAVVGAAVLDARREHDLILAQLAESQAFHAELVAENLSGRADLRLASAEPSEALVAHLKRVEALSGSIVFVRRNGRIFERLDGSSKGHELLDHAFESGQTSLILPNDAAPIFGLAPRRAIAGFGSVPGSNFAVSMVSSSALERERRSHVERRTAISVFAATSAVLAAALFLIRRERRAHQLAALLARASLEEARDAEIARAERFAMLAALSTGIAHELSTPLAVLVTRLEQLEPAAARDPGLSRIVDAMTTQTSRMSAIIRSFLGLARGESPSTAPTTLQAVCDDVEALVRHRFTRAEVPLVVECSDPHAIFRCDPPVFSQALSNLLLNALQATIAVPPADGGSRPVRLVAGCDASGTLSFAVTDHGVGISPEVAARATTPFFSTRLASGGTGLGLAISRELVTQHHGELTISARTDGERGTVARMVFRAAAAKGGA